MRNLQEGCIQIQVPFLSSSLVSLLLRVSLFYIFRFSFVLLGCVKSSLSLFLTSFCGWFAAVHWVVSRYTKVSSFVFFPSEFVKVHIGISSFTDVNF